MLIREALQQKAKTKKILDIVGLKLAFIPVIYVKIKMENYSL